MRSHKCQLQPPEGATQTRINRRKLTSATPHDYAVASGDPYMNTSASVELIKLTLCGPTDVAKEIALAAEAINDWNCQHGEKRGFWVKHQHWSTDSYPDAQETGQG